MELKIKALSPEVGTEIPLPRFATAGAACMDLCACIDEAVTLAAGERRLVPTGIAIALPSAGWASRRACAFPTAWASSTATTGARSAWGW